MSRYADDDRAGGRNTLTRDADADLCETDTQKERRLAREVRECIGRITHPDIPAKTGQWARVEVSYQPTEDDIERAGYFGVTFPVDEDPYECAAQLVEEAAEHRWPDAAYFNIDDILSR